MAPSGKERKETGVNVESQQVNGKTKTSGNVKNKLEHEGPVATAATKGSKGKVEDEGVLPYTPLDEIPVRVARLTESFHKTRKTHSIQYRLNQLRNLYFAVKDNVDPLCDALYKDFYRLASETKNLEITGGLSELLHVMSSLHKWIQPEKVTDLPVSMLTTPVYIERVPLGTVLVISPFNYPFLLSLSSIVAALAGGNVVVFKPSELTPHFSKLFCEIVSNALDDDIFYAINGAIPETTKALEQKYDKIMYTGSTMVGTIIAKKAAETLTPVLLELGGKSPCFVLDDVKDKDLPTIARRIVWGRFTNCGQTCVAVDYVLAHASIKDKLVKAMVKVVEEEFYGSLNKDDRNYTHLIHDRAFANLSRVLDDTKGNVIVGGLRDESSRFFSPTIIDNCSWDDSTMKAELFGPLLPILTYTDLSVATAEVVQNHDFPLAQYIFTSGSTSRKNPQVDQILTSVRSGGAVVNDVLMHFSLTNAPIGGVGASGQGAYHGYYSFRAFTHERTTMEQPLFNDFALAARYPPFNDKKDKLIQSSLSRHNGNVWFGRTGDVRYNGPNPLWSFWTGFTGICTLGYNLVNSL